MSSFAVLPDLAMVTKGRELVSVLRLGTLGYGAALAVQNKLVARIQAGEGGSSLVVVQHPPVYTTGMRTKEYSEEEERRLRGLGADFVRTNRGGLITFHGPGQLVAYPIMNLRRFAPETAARKAMLGMKWYVNSLEQMVIDLCEDFGIKAARSPHTGIMSTQSTHYIYKFKYFLSTINFKCKKYFLKI